MRKSFSKGSECFEILDKDDSVLEFHDRPTAVAFLRRFRNDIAQMAILRAALVGSRANVHSMSAEDIIEQFASLMIAGRLKILRSRRPSRGRSVAEAEAEQDKMKAASSATPARAVQKKHWVEFRVIDDETGKPIEGVQLTIKVPGGSAAQCTTDAGGFVELYDILEGDCEVTCDLSDAQVSNTYNFVRVI